MTRRWPCPRGGAGRLVRPKCGRQLQGYYRSAFPVRRPIFKFDPDRTSPNHLGHRFRHRARVSRRCPLRYRQPRVLRGPHDARGSSNDLCPWGLSAIRIGRARAKPPLVVASASKPAATRTGALIASHVAAEITWNSVASPRNVPFQGMVKSIKIRRGKTVRHGGFG